MKALKIFMMAAVVLGVASSARATCTFKESANPGVTSPAVLGTMTCTVSTGSTGFGRKPGPTTQTKSYELSATWGIPLNVAGGPLVVVAKPTVNIPAPSPFRTTSNWRKPAVPQPPAKVSAIRTTLSGDDIRIEVAFQDKGVAPITFVATVVPVLD